MLNITLSKIAVEWTALPLHIRTVLGSNLVPETAHFEISIGLL
jgi:hypothetical protein